MEPSLIISIVSISITILFGIWNARISIENHKMRKDEYIRDKQRYYKEEFDLRPKLEIIKTKKNIDGNLKRASDIDVDCLVIPIKDVIDKDDVISFYYDEKFLNKDDWVNIDFILKNIGKSPITEMWATWNSPKNISMFDVKNDEYKFGIKNQLLNYRVLLEKELKPDNIVTVRFNFHKDFIAYGMISAEASFWLFDDYKKIWEQPLFVHRNVIYDSKQVSYKEFKNFTDIEDALKCFKNPYLW